MTQSRSSGQKTCPSRAVMVPSMSSAASGVTASLVNEGFEESRMEPDLRQRTGGTRRRVLAFEPSVRQVMVRVRVPSECEEKVGVEQERQHSPSCRLTRLSVRGVLSRDTANSGEPVSPCGSRCPPPQSSPRQLGHDAAHRDVPLARKRARRLENLVIDVQGRSHARYTSFVMRRCHKGSAREISVSNLVRFIPVGILR